MKPLEGCEHVCSAKCHTGPCPPCSIRLVRPCRCGSTTHEVLCSEEQTKARARARGETGAESDILCERTCPALRACGRHQCNRVCCPLASLAVGPKGKGKQRATENTALMDPEGWHECDIVCGRLLSCGNHNCEERDHKGACPPCLRSSFEEVRRKFEFQEIQYSPFPLRWCAIAAVRSWSLQSHAARGSRVVIPALALCSNVDTRGSHTRATMTLFAAPRVLT